jgi:hypothetical protein
LKVRGEELKGRGEEEVELPAFINKAKVEGQGDQKQH